MEDFRLSGREEIFWSQKKKTIAANPAGAPPAGPSPAGAPGAGGRGIPAGRGSFRRVPRRRLSSPAGAHPPGAPEAQDTMGGA